MTRPEEEAHAVTAPNSTERHYPHRTVDQLIDEQARDAPDRVAVVAADGTASYRELVRRANHLAHRLRAVGVKNESLVGVCLERSLSTVVGVISVLKAGGAYVPLDPAYPADRLAFILADSGATVILTQRSLEGMLEPAGATVLYIDDEAGEMDDPPADGAVFDGLAYVLYTSGSTGNPKGVQIEHRALVNFLHSMRETPGLTSNDVLLAITTLSFDIAGLELYLPLITGARIVMASREAATNCAVLGDLITTSGATVLQATPTTWRLLVEAGWPGAPGLKAFCGGESLAQPLAAQLVARTAELWNLYGPTETTIWSAAKRVDNPDLPITIGSPIANTRIYVLDASGQPQPVGVPGEIAIGGDGVARGYLNRPRLTAEKFVPDDLAPASGARRYLTGDRGRFGPNGEVEFLGRLDHQLKIHGFRIEPGEIEAALLEHPGVRAAVVVPRGPADDQRLVAYVVWPPGPELHQGELRAHLRRTLPEYMVPSAFVPLAAFPITPNGKVDRAQLPEPVYVQDRPLGRVAPRDATEERLAEIWRRMLKLPEVGVTDQFFDLGGHSLLAVRLMAEIEKTFHRRIPLAVFFDGDGTIASVARALDAGSDAADAPVKVTMRGSSGTPPLFFVHPDDTSMFSLRHFHEGLGGQQPIIGLLPQRDRRRYDRGSSVENLASGLLPLVQQEQPAGPLAICGYSFGGILAYELAHQLRHAGREVAFLGLIDALSPEMTRVEGEWTARAMRPTARVRRVLASGPRDGAAKAAGVVARAAGRAWAVRPGAARVGRFDLDGAYGLTIGYRPTDLGMPLTLFRSADEGSNFGQDMGWGAVCGGKLECLEVPGDHQTMLVPPHVAVLAEELAVRLRAAQHGAALLRSATA